MKVALTVTMINDDDGDGDEDEDDDDDDNYEIMMTMKLCKQNNFGIGISKLLRPLTIGARSTED